MPALLYAVALLFGQQKDSPFADVLIEKPFDVFLSAHPLLMGDEGAKIVRRPDGTALVIGVASTPVRDGSARDRKRAETVCKNRALASIVSEDKGVVVAHVEKSQSSQTVVVDADGKKKTKSVKEYLETTSSHLDGVLPGFQVIGRWKSADGKLYYYAVGGILDAKGKLVRESTP
jgi:hypothetical protein